MKRPKSIATFTDLLVLVVVVMLNPINPYLPSKVQPCIPDRVEIRCPVAPQGDTLQLQAQLSEMDYYLRMHRVSDEGYQAVAQYNTTLQQRLHLLKAHHPLSPVTTRRVAAKDRQLVAVHIHGGSWKSGRFMMGRCAGPALFRDHSGRIVSALWRGDSIVTAVRYDSTGVYRGQMNRLFLANGEGCYDSHDGSHYEGFFADDHRHGFGFESTPRHVRAGEWRTGRFLGERMRYTTERIYGIDISRHQHEKGRRRFGINWKQLRITSLGKRHDTEGHTYPISFIYIKSTEGTTVRNRYFMSDYAKAKRYGLHVGAYHFFSLTSSAEAQANYFVNNTLFRKGDFPPVLDVEPSDAQIARIGGDEELLRRIRIFMHIVERRTGMRPILYISQMFVNHHMQHADDIKQRYNVWIARYGQYKPDVKLVFWQLCADGKVSGITGPVDINVFNGYQAQFDDFVQTGFHK